MTENEAINRLRDHFRIHDDGRPTPYLDDAVSIAFKALEKQIAKKTILQITDEKSLYKCPCCNRVFVEAYDNVQRGYIPKFCEMCGQSISFRLE